MKFFLLTLATLLFIAASCSSLKKTYETEPNKKIVQDFYQLAFNDHQPVLAAETYLSEQYKQHNPYVADGRKPFTDYFLAYFKKNPQARAIVKRVIVEDNFVVLHVHSYEKPGDKGVAVVDIFRLQDGKIVEHWDVVQPVVEKPANTNTMF